MEYKTPKIFGKDEDGEYLGRIDEIGSGKGLKLFGKTIIPESKDMLMISNRRSNLWVFSLFNGYRQIGRYSVLRPNEFQEGEDVIVTKKEGKIIKVIKSN